MATKKRTESKSDRMRAMFRAGTTIAQVTKDPKLGVGYAFAYGVADRLAKSDPTFDIRTVAGERKRRAVTIDKDNGNVKVAVTTGFVTVTPAGKIIRSKS